MFENFSDIEMKKWISDNKVLFVTNSTCVPGSTFLSSMRTYIDYLPIHNFTLIPGIKNDEPYYGINVFLELIGNMMSDRLYKKFDYVIYIDEDAFICDFKALLEEFYIFMKDDNYCLAGPQDGGVFCHRNHAHYMINTFISFWNMKLLRNSTTVEDFAQMLNTINQDQTTSYKTFMGFLRGNEVLYDIVKNSADVRIKEVESFRKRLFPNGETPYSETVKNDENNHIEPNQIPYSYKDDIEEYNFEPYYLVEQVFILLTQKPIYYLFATDYYNSEYSDDEVDNSGLSSAIYSSYETHILIAVHTWFARAYSRYPQYQLQLVHTNRINKIIKKFGKL